MSDMWDIYQHVQIGEIKATGETTKVKAIATRRDLEFLEQKVAALSIACHALWELLSVGKGLTQADLERKIEEIDLRDGKLDGKLSLNIQVCSDCGHKLRPRFSYCFYCGAALPKAGSF